MKLQNLFENQVTQDQVKDYLYKCELMGGDRARAEDFKRYLKSSHAEFKGIDFVENALSKLKREQFINRCSSELFQFKINGDNSVSFDSFDIYGYDFIGPPPFKVKDVFLGFSVFSNASTLIEIPDWFPETAYSISLGETGVNSLRGIDKIVKECIEFQIYNNAHVLIRSHVLGLFSIKKLTIVDFADQKELSDIIQKHLKDGDIFECQEELIEAGFKEHAQL